MPTLRAAVVGFSPGRAAGGRKLAAAAVNNARHAGTTPAGPVEPSTSNA
jgi:hypothetical protein